MSTYSSYRKYFFFQYLELIYYEHHPFKVHESAVSLTSAGLCHRQHYLPQNQPPKAKPCDFLHFTP